MLDPIGQFPGKPGGGIVISERINKPFTYCEGVRLSERCVIGLKIAKVFPGAAGHCKNLKGNQQCSQ
jgi:hypothetical protein